MTAPQLIEILKNVPPHLQVGIFRALPEGGHEYFEVLGVSHTTVTPQQGATAQAFEFARLVLYGDPDANVR